MIPKAERDRLEIFERMIRNMQEQKNQQIGNVKADYYRNSVKMGRDYEKDGGYWDSNAEMAARALAKKQELIQI